MNAIYEAIENGRTKTFRLNGNGSFVYVVSNDDIKATLQRMLRVENLSHRKTARMILENVKDTVTFHQDEWAEWFSGLDIAPEVTYHVHCHIIIFKDGVWEWIPLAKANVNIRPYYEDGTYHEGYDSEKDYWESVCISEVSVQKEVWVTFDEYSESNIVGLREGDDFNVDLSPLSETRQCQLATIFEERFVKQVAKVGALASAQKNGYKNLAFLWS